MSDKIIIGRSVYVNIEPYAKKVPAKVDTGADSSAIWASDIRVDEKGRLNFKLFDKGSLFYTGKNIVRKDFIVAKVRGATGHVVIKYKTRMSLTIGDKKIKAFFGLSNRSSHSYPILIGRRTLAKSFLVDTSLSEIDIRSISSKGKGSLIREMKKDPVAFHKKYYENNN